MDKQPKDKINWERTGAILFCVISAAALVFIISKYALGIIMPFLIAWLISFAVRPLANKISQKSGIPRKPIAAFLLVGAIALLAGAATWGIGRAIRELEGLLESMGSGDSELQVMLATATDVIKSITSHLPLPEAFKSSPEFEDFRASLDSSVYDAVTGSLTGALSSLCEKIPGAAISIAKALPSAILFFVALFLSGYYFSVGKDSDSNPRRGEDIPTSLLACAFPSFKERLPIWKRRISTGASKYLRAYLLLMLITFAEMFIGFSVIGVKYSFILASVVAIVDFLPVLGAGTVILPWAGLAYLTGDRYVALGLLIIYGISLIIRQLIEPKIVGSSLGIHPLASLAAMYIGYYLFGILGLILAPIAATVARSAVDGEDEL